MTPDGHRGAACGRTEGRFCVIELSSWPSSNTRPERCRHNRPMSITGGDVADLGRGLYAWLPPKRGWGLANCGLLVSPRGALWIDTPYDPVLGGQFLAESEKRLPDGVTIDRVIVTHANGDHFWGSRRAPGRRDHRDARGAGAHPLRAHPEAAARTRGRQRSGHAPRRVPQPPLRRLRLVGHRTGAADHVLHRGARTDPGGVRGPAVGPAARPHHGRPDRPSARAARRVQRRHHLLLHRGATGRPPDPLVAPSAM